MAAPLLALVAFTGCSGGHGFLGTDFQPKNDIRFSDAVTKAPLTTSKASPYRTANKVAAIGITETNFQGPYTVSIVSFNNGSTTPCFVPSATVAVGVTTIEQFTASGTCVSDGSDIETALVTDGKGNSAFFYLTLDQSFVAGNFLALSPNRGLNYHGVLLGNPVTLTLYEDPSTTNSTTLVLLSASGTQADATSGTKQGAVSIVGSAQAGFGIANYTLYNTDGTTFAQGMLPAGSLLVPASLYLGQTYTPYPGMSATVVASGNVPPGGSACAVPKPGATVQYLFQGGTYLISYVPDCGITQYVGNNGETFTLSSVGVYSQLGTLGDVKAMGELTLLDNVTSAVRIVVSGTGFSSWHLGQK